jgi:hypothetical protein
MQERNRERDIFGLHKHRAIRDEKEENEIYRTHKTINRRASKQKNFVYKMGGSNDEDKSRVNR